MPCRTRSEGVEIFNEMSASQLPRNHAGGSYPAQSAIASDMEDWLDGEPNNMNCFRSPYDYVAHGRWVRSDDTGFERGELALRRTLTDGPPQAVAVVKNLEAQDGAP